MKIHLRYLHIYMHVCKINYLKFSIVTLLTCPTLVWTKKYSMILSNFPHAKKYEDILVTVVSLSKLFGTFTT